MKKSHIKVGCLGMGLILLFLCSVQSYLDLSCLILLSRSFFFLLLVGIIKFLGLVFA